MNRISSTNKIEYPLINALCCQPASRTPVWFMRQAGRYLPEYRELRAKHSLITMMCEPELAAEVTLQPLRRFDLDAAIVFADILTPLISLGVGLQFIDGEGPKLEVQRDANGGPILRVTDQPVAEFTCKTLKLVRKELEGTPRALIGFCGAPFTTAAYLLEDSIGSRKELVKTRRFMRSHPDAWKSLQETLSNQLARYLLEQADSGAQAVQIFDSWIGALSPWEFNEYVLPALKNLISKVRKQSSIPIIYFGLANHGHLSSLNELDINCVGVDWTLKLKEAQKLLGRDDLALQGNLDPTLLLPGNDGAIREATRDVLAQAHGLPGFIFNVGHGLQPTSQIAAIEQVIETIRK